MIELIIEGVSYMSNKPHSRVKRVSDKTIKVEKRPIGSQNEPSKRRSILKGIFSIIKK